MWVWALCESEGLAGLKGHANPQFWRLPLGAASGIGFVATTDIMSGCRAHPDVELSPSHLVRLRPARQIGRARRFPGRARTEAAEYGNSGATNHW
jgi:hypothetical protein